MLRTVNAYAEFERVIDFLVPPSRRGNNATYCMSVLEETSGRTIEYYNVTGRLVGDATHYHHQGRYAKVNLQSYITHKTIEFRHFGATTNYKKIVSWIWLTQRLTARAMRDNIQNCTRHRAMNDLLSYLEIVQGTNRIDDETLVFVKHIIWRFKKNVKASVPTLADARRSVILSTTF